MADIKLFKIGVKVEEVISSNALLEKHLQIVIENNMQGFFGVTFLASEFATNNGGRMDSIGIDENYCPVIFEYKRNQNENVINQGLFYLDWLLSHKDSFKVLVIEKLGINIAGKIDWTMPRLICIAGDFNKYDESAINQMNRNISLIRYKKFGQDFLMLEQLNQNVAKPIEEQIDEVKPKQKVWDKWFQDFFNSATEENKTMFYAVTEYVSSLGDDVIENKLKLYYAYKKIKNFACVQIDKNKVIVNLHLDAKSMQFEDGFSRDVTDIGHWGTGNVQIWIKNQGDFEKAKPYIDRAYREN